MVSWVYLSDIASHVGSRVALKGWVMNRRSSGGVHFVIFRDGTGIIQASFSKEAFSGEAFESIGKVPLESSMEVSGTVVAEPRSMTGYEIRVESYTLVQSAEGYPIGKKEHGVDFLMDHRHLWLRAPRQRAILRIRDTIIKSIRDFFYDRGFTLVDAPVFTPSACEGTSNLFEVGYFDEKAYLTQSGQLYMEAACMALGKVYCFGPTFRAEKSKTRRHLTEFWMVEPEIAYIDMEGNLKLQEEFVEHIVQRVLSRHKKELKLLERDIAPLEKVRTPFERLHYEEAIRVLNENGSDIKWGDDLGGDDETILTKLYEKPIFVHHYPRKCKAFYMKKDPIDDRYALCADMLAPEGYGEIIGGSIREEDINELLAAISNHGLKEEHFKWYLDLRKYGSVPHGGFGLGIERTVAWICGLHHVRETIPFPRMLNRLTP
ncbi:MAG: asparagine--tRNA ligase [Candidatus Wallbacteria bacterium]|nr:asparagine--tRNA ligase [Candidatus Wallbacteria bacterium]